MREFVEHFRPWAFVTSEEYLKHFNSVPSRTACGKNTSAEGVSSTSYISLVTCEVCKKTRIYKSFMKGGDKN
ncbi:MAG: hypothetical protein PVG39_11315 [Desulfobacteraceae bacterium]|jgi:hypothetical protein